MGIGVAGIVGAREHAHRVPDRRRPGGEHRGGQPLLLQVDEDLARLLDVEHEHHADQEREQRIDVEPGVAQDLDPEPDTLLPPLVLRRGFLLSHDGGGFTLVELRLAQRLDRLVEFHRSLPGEQGCNSVSAYAETNCGSDPELPSDHRRRLPARPYPHVLKSR